MKENSLYTNEDYEFELINRMKNLMWTVSGDYSSEAQIDIKSYKISKYICLYDAIKQGAFSHYFSRGELGMYLAKKMYLGADDAKLIAVSQLALEAACYKKITADRPGVIQIRRRALEDTNEYYFDSLSATAEGVLRLNMNRFYLGSDFALTKDMTDMKACLLSLTEAADTRSVIEVIDGIYNRYFDRSFLKLHGGLDDVLKITLEELAESDWADFLKEASSEDAETIVQSALNSAFSSESLNGGKKTQGGGSVLYLDEEAIKKMASYIELTFGKNMLDEKENLRIEREICRGIHKNCKLYFTRGLLRSAKGDYYRCKYAAMRNDKNKRAYYENHRIVKRNIAQLADILKKELMMRSMPEYVRADTGSILAREMWRVGRAPLNRVFEKKIKHDETDFVVDVLIDASGSQSERQGKVSLQGYILAEALTELNIPVRITGFCTFWEYTVLNVYRDYDENKSFNSRLFEYMTTANNRDGLAVKAAVSALLKRREENKVLIVLSDGRPHDVNINRPGRLEPDVYSGEEAVADTARCVREARAKGIAVLGVFAGREEDLAAEKKIFGKDFAYIRDIKYFSGVVGAYLKKQIENM